MNKQDFLQFSREGRKWFRLLLPYFFAGSVGWHFPQPFWMKWFKKEDKP